MNEKNIETLLVKLVGEMKSLNAEVRGLRAELRKRAGEPEPVVPEKPKPWSGGAVAVTKQFGRVVETETADIPSGITSEMRRITEEQAREANPKGVETFKADPVESEPEPIRFTDEQIANFKGFRGVRR
jgi:hypothetical protein